MVSVLIAGILTSSSLWAAENPRTRNQQPGNCPKPPQQTTRSKPSSQRYKYTENFIIFFLI